jgi:signal transduction histidine kinase
LAGSCILVDAFLHGASAYPIRAVSLAVLTAAPLLFRRRWPLGVLVVTMAGAVLCAGALEAPNGAVAAALVPLFDVAAFGSRRRSIVVGVATAATLVLATALFSSQLEVGSAAIRLLLLLGAIAVGEIYRSRRALQREEARRRDEEALRQQREQEQRIVEERLRIARDVHDSIAHALVAINVQAGVAAHLGPNASMEETLTEIKQLSADALTELRATLGLVRPGSEQAPTSPASDLGALPELLERSRSAGLDVDMTVSLDGRPVPAAVGQAGFRIVQESLTNILRHAGASRATICVRSAGDHLELIVEDDGSPAAPQPAAGHGLQGMRERAAAIGGELRAGPNPTGGWRVHATLPTSMSAT